MNKFVGVIITVLVSFFGLTSAVVAQTEHSGSITSDETWTQGGNPHIIKALTTVSNNATLTIEAGVEVRFNIDAINPTLIIGTAKDTGAKLIAKGTETNPITFTSDAGAPQPGDWNAIFFWPTASPDSVIENAIIEYGGGAVGATGNLKFYGSSPKIRNSIIRRSSGPGIQAVVSGSPEISGCMIQDNSGPGVDISQSSPVMDNNNFKDNGTYPIRIGNISPPGPIIYGTNAFSGNNPDLVYFNPGSITFDYTMREIEIAYFFPSLTTVNNDATLTIDAGVEIRFNRDAVNPRLIIGTSRDTGATLVARGTESKKITFTSNSSVPQPGDWNAILFWPTASPDSIIENAIIEYGGGVNGSTGNISIFGASPTINNSTIRHSKGSAIDVLNNGSPQISCCDLTDNLIGIRASNPGPDLYTYGNNILGNSEFGAANDSSTTVIDATENWWGDASGPAGAGPGTGDPVSQYINYAPWLTRESACTSAICEGDVDADGDVDGDDLKHLVDKYRQLANDLNDNSDAAFFGSLSLSDFDLAKFAEDFGRKKCPYMDL